MNDLVAQVHNAFAAMVQMYQGLLQASVTERNLLQAKVVHLEQELAKLRGSNAVQESTPATEIPRNAIKG